MAMRGKKKEARKKKRQSEKMAMKQRKSCGNLQTKILAKIHAKNHFRWKLSKGNASMKMKTRKQQLLLIHDTEKHAVLFLNH